MLLKKSESIPRVIELYGMDGKGIPQPVWADVMDSACFRVYKLGQTCALSAGLDDLPCPVAVDAKQELLAVFLYRATESNIFTKERERIPIDRQDPLATVLLLISSGFIYFTTTFWAENM